MRSSALRLLLIAILVVATAVSALANTLHSRLLGRVDLAIFFVAVAVFLRWRRAALAERRGRVFDQEAKTDEARARPDQ